MLDCVRPSLNTQSWIKMILVEWNSAFWAVWVASKTPSILIKYATFEGGSDFKLYFFGQNRLKMGLSNLNALQEGNLMQEWVFRLGCHYILTYAQQMRGANMK